MFGAVKQKTLLPIVIMLLSLGSADVVVLNAQPMDSIDISSLGARQYWDDVLYSSSTHIFTGIVLSVESRWTEVDGSKTIFSYASVSISENFKGGTGSQITLVYEGGTVSNATLIVFINPWGRIECRVGDRIKAFTIQDKSESSMFQAIDVDVISMTESGAKILASTGAGMYIYEDYRVGFQYTQDYLGGEPVDYWINNEGSGWIWDKEATYQAVRNAFQTWQNEPLSNKVYNDRGLVYGRWDGHDGYNVVCWKNEGPFWGLARTRYWPWPWEFREFDIIFNDYYPWTLNPGIPDYYDVQNAATHEVGHTLPLDDLYLGENSEQTMYHITEKGEGKKRDLEPGDKAGIQYLYPQYEKPVVSIERPYNGQYFWGEAYIEIWASVNSPAGLNWVKFHAWDYIYYEYDSGWYNMVYDPGTGKWYKGWYTTGAPRDRWYYILVKAESSQGMFGYDIVQVCLST